MVGGTGNTHACALVASLLAWWSTHCAAAELIPTVAGDAVGVEIRGLQLPDTARKDLTSGLTNRILIRIALTVDGEAVTRVVVAIGVKYDLWEESFSMTTSVAERPPGVRSFSSIEEAVAALSDLSIGRVLQTADLQGGRAYTLQAEVLFDPIERERMEKIRQWVAQNSALPAGGTPVGGGASQSAELFNRIFQQYAAGADIGSAWRELVVSRPFRLEDLEARPPAQ